MVEHADAIIMLIEDGEAKVVRAYGYGDTERFLHPIREVSFRSSRLNELRELARSGESLLITDTEKYSSWISTPETAWIRSYLGAPIRVEGVLIGFLNLDSKTPGSFTADDARRLQVFADAAALAIRNARLYEALGRSNETLAQTIQELTRQLEDEKNRLETIFRSVEEIIVVIDAGGLIQRTNLAFQEQTGYGRPEVLGYSLREFFPNLSTAPPGKESSPTISRPTWHSELAIERTDGRCYDTAVAITPLSQRSGESSGAVISMRDISELKEATRMKGAFVRNVSHELHAP